MDMIDTLLALDGVTLLALDGVMTIRPLRGCSSLTLCVRSVPFASCTIRSIRRYDSGIRIVSLSTNHCTISLHNGVVRDPS